MFAAVDALVGPEILVEAQSLFETVILAALGALGTIFTVGMAFLSRRIVAWFDAKAKKAKADAKSAEAGAHYEALKCMTEKLETLSTTAVAEVEQTLVRQFKSEPQGWNAETALRARDTAVEVMTRHAGEKGLAAMMECSGLARDALLGMFRTWVEMKVGQSSTKDKSPPLGKGAPIVSMNKPAQADSKP
jgi:hypothetical protein